MVQDPQHQLRDSSGNILGTYWADQDSVYVEHPSGEQVEITSSGVNIENLLINNTEYQEDIQDIVAALVGGGANITTTYNDTNNTFTIDTSALNEEQVEDTVASLITTSSGITFNYDDVNDSITLELDQHASTHEKGGVDELTTFGDTTHDSVSTDDATIPWQFPQDVTNQHDHNTFYQNNSDKPIKVTAIKENSGGGIKLAIDVGENGTDSDFPVKDYNTNAPPSHRKVLSVVVPSASYYRVSEYVTETVDGVYVSEVGSQ